MSLKPVRTLPLGWELEIERILNSADQTRADALTRSVSDHSDQQISLRALKLGFHLALRERDSLLRQYETLDAIRRGMRPDDAHSEFDQDTSMSESMVSNVPPPLTIPARTLDSLNVGSPKLNNRENELNSNRHLLADNAKPIPSPKFHQPFAMSEMLIEPVDEEGDGKTTWEFLTVTLNRVPGYGFGIAVSGGRDNPHFRSGEPSIVISDVLRAGPAWGQLQINDRIVSANGVNLEQAEYTAAVQIMKESDQLNMIIKRRVPLPSLEFEQRTLKFTLTKSRRKDNFGIVLGCKFYIRDITNPRLAEKDPGLREGDTVLRINGQTCEDLTLTDACKLLERSKDKLSLVVQRDVPRGANWKWGSQTTLYERLGSVAETPRDSPRASPVVTNRYSAEGPDVRLNNTRGSGRYQQRMAASDYVNAMPSTSSTMRYSYGGGSSPQPPGRRTPRDSSADEYGALGVPRSMPPSSPPHQPPASPAPFPTDENLFNANTVLDGTTSPVAHKPPLPLLSETRPVSFRKEGGSVGVRVIGGNEVGIFVSAVQNGSPASNKGVRPGDKILQVNSRDMRGVTREEAVLYLLGLQENVDLVLQHRKDEYDRVRAQNLGDNFYIRVHFDHEKPDQGEVSFRRGDIFQVTDTLFGGTVGAWQAIKLSSPSSPDRSEPGQAKGVIPNASRAEKLASLDTFRLSRTLSSEQQRSGTFFKRKFGAGVGRRSKSLTKNHWDEVVFGQGNVNFPAYERVKLKHPGFLRPVVLFGPLSDVARDLLLKDFPLRFAIPASEGVPSASDASKNTSGIVRLSAIRDVMAKNKHCLLDATPSSVEKLQYAQYCPIIVFVGVDARSRLRDLRAKANHKSNVSTKKLIDQAGRIQKHYSHLFSATLDASKEDQWFEAMRELISHLQERRVWMSEQRPTELMEDDFLFPMGSSRYGTYMGDSSDVESLKGDYSSEIGTPKIQHDGLTESMYENSRVVNGGSRPIGRVPAPGGLYGDISVYRNPLVNGRPAANHHSMASHVATLRRPPQAPPKPPTRCYPVVPPKPSLSTMPPKPLLTSPSAEDNNRTLTEEESAGSLTSIEPTSSAEIDVVPAREVQPSPSKQQMMVGRHYSEPGYYDVKQILADHSSDYDDRTSPSPSPRHNGTGYFQFPSSAPNAYYARHTETVTAPRMVGNYEQVPRTLANGPTQRPVYRPFPSVVPPSPRHPAFRDNDPLNQMSPYNQQRMAVGYPPAGYQVPANLRASGTNPISRTSSMPVASGQQLRNGVPRQHVLAPSKSPVPPPPPAPKARSNQVYSPRLAPQTSAAGFSSDHSVSPQPQDAAIARLSSQEESTPSPPIKENGNLDANCNETSQSPRKPPVPQKPTILTVSAHDVQGSHSEPEHRPDQNGLSDSATESERNEEQQHTVVAHVSGVFDSNGGQLSSAETGVSVHIPQGALPTGAQQEIYFKVCRDTTMAPPLDADKGETLLSPLVMCGPQGLKFEKPVELRLPHSASGVNSEQWSFALKSASGAESEWKQVSLADNTSAGKLNDNFVSVMIDHF